MVSVESLRSLPFEAFIAELDSRSARISPNSQRTPEQLYADYLRGEIDFVEVDGVLKRYTRAVYIDVYYQVADGRRFILEEQRGRLNEGKTIDSYLDGDTDAVSFRPKRIAPPSLSERMHANERDEDPVVPAIRAVREELFDFALRYNSSDQFEDLEEQIRMYLYGHTPFSKEYDSNDPQNSYQGIPSIVAISPFEIVFNQDSHVPIHVDSQGIPQPLIEYYDQRGYVNVFQWREIPNSPV